jgi:hypothetical protein
MAIRDGDHNEMVHHVRGDLVATWAGNTTMSILIWLTTCRRAAAAEAGPLVKTQVTSKYL